MSEPKAPALCIPTSRVNAVLGDLAGYRGLPEIEPYTVLKDLTAGNACSFQPREPEFTNEEEDENGERWLYTCENDPSFKQIIPYLCLIQSGRVLTYLRDTSGGEAKLHGKRSVGLGGHVEECDLRGHPPSWVSAIERAATRELLEETTDSVGANYAKSLIGFVNDNSNAVGRVHLGLLYLVTLSPTVAPKFAREIADPQWQDPAAIDPSGYEGWSRIAIEAMRDGRIGL